MPTTTPDNLRYPLRADKPAGADQIEALAADVQAALMGVRAGLRFATGKIAGGVITNQASFPVTFPAGRFTSPPLLFLSWYEGQFGEATVLSSPAVTTAGATVAVRGSGGASTIVRVAWLAVQVSS